MENDIPRIAFSENSNLDVEVMSFPELCSRLDLSKDHDPFSVHRIEFYLILIVNKGSYSHFIDFKSYDLVGGSALFIAKNQVHRFDETIKEADGICIVFNRLFMDKYYFLSDNYKLNRIFNYHIEGPVIHQTEMNRDSLIEVATQLYNEYHIPNDFAKSEMLRTLLNLLLLKAERAKAVQSTQVTPADSLETFCAFRDLLEKEYTNTRSARAYAKNLFVSYKLLNNTVKKLTGKTVKAFIDDFVTTEIKRYLVSTALSIQEVSYKTGFEEPSNMVKFFKKNTNTTPRQFRQLT